VEHKTNFISPPPDKEVSEESIMIEKLSKLNPFKAGSVASHQDNSQKESKDTYEERTATADEQRREQERKQREKMQVLQYTDDEIIKMVEELNAHEFYQSKGLQFQFDIHTTTITIVKNKTQKLQTLYPYQLTNLVKNLSREESKGGILNITC
jgi:uncharacterized FlaG/YvyC family protein